MPSSESSQPQANDYGQQWQSQVHTPFCNDHDTLTGDFHSNAKSLYLCIFGPGYRCSHCAPTDNLLENSSHILQHLHKTVYTVSVRNLPTLREQSLLRSAEYDYAVCRNWYSRNKNFLLSLNLIRHSIKPITVLSAFSICQYYSLCTDINKYGHEMHCNWLHHWENTEHAFRPTVIYEYTKFIKDITAWPMKNTKHKLQFHRNFLIKFFTHVILLNNYTTIIL
jgi:hypothetical protein